MNIGIIVFSRTGNTLSVAEKIREACQSQGHTVQIERVTAENGDPNNKGTVRLKTTPDPVNYDAVFFGAPVQAFSLSPIMAAYLKQIPQLNGKKVSCFVTQYFPKPWMGGNKALKQMLQFCTAKGASISETSIINWTGKSRDAQIIDTSAKLSII